MNPFAGDPPVTKRQSDTGTCSVYLGQGYWVKIIG